MLPFFSIIEERQISNTLAERIDMQLMAVNQEYAQKRKSGRLVPLALEAQELGWAAQIHATAKRDIQFKWRYLTEESNKQVKELRLPN